MRKRTFVLAGALACLHSAAWAQIGWNAPFPPHRIIDNIYFVGTEALGSFLIATPEGHILVNSNFESTVPIVQANVEALGFRFSQIRALAEPAAG
jgi:metallo-beta-lactamase class B